MNPTVFEKVIFRTVSYWNIVLEDLRWQFPEHEGLRYLGHLLTNPGKRFPAASLPAALGDPESPGASTVLGRIREAIALAQEEDATLGLHLARSIRLGGDCSYLPTEVGGPSTNRLLGQG